MMTKSSADEAVPAESGVAGGLALLAATAIALIWANSPLSHSYESVWGTLVGFHTEPFALRLSLHQWVNDGLMAIFFFTVGREIKYEVVLGKLASLRRAALPIAAAIGGMIVPALIYTALNAGGPGADGWGVPMATDIAFALAILTFAGRGAPEGLHALLAAIAVVDDLGAIFVIAVFYGAHLHWLALGGAGLLFAALVGLGRLRIPGWVYVFAGLALWLLIVDSGVHASIAGVLLAFAMPSSHSSHPPRALGLFVTFVILPLFALSNAGVSLAGLGASIVHDPVTLGVFGGLLLGKPIGVMAASMFAVKSGMAQLPSDVTWRQVHGVAWLAGIGFTVALFVAELAFANEATLNAAKLGILAASTSAGVIGSAILRRGKEAVVRA